MTANNTPKGTPPSTEAEVTARALRRFHAVATIVWVILTVPTLLWWRHSILWVALMSIYAVVVSHATAWQAARAEHAAENTETPDTD